MLAAPAMNWRMWEHPATQRNLAQLKADGVHFVGPNEGGMACNEWGLGRMAEVDEIVSAAERLLVSGDAKSLTGRHVLVTAGPTFEPIDPVRFIGNRSSGKQGYAIATAAARLGAQVTLVGARIAAGAWAFVWFTWRRHKKCWKRWKLRFRRMSASLARRLLIGARLRFNRKKSRKERPLPRLRLVENPDILKTISKRTDKRPQLVIGFAAETEKIIAHAALRSWKARDAIGSSPMTCRPKTGCSAAVELRSI